MNDSPIVRDVSGISQKGRSTADDSSLGSSWERFHGPRGGEGWQNPETGEVRYQDDPPDGTGGVEDNDEFSGTAENVGSGSSEVEDTDPGEWVAPSIEDPIKAPEDFAGGGMEREERQKWIDDNFFAGQRIKLRSAAGDIEEKVVQSIHQGFNQDDPLIKHGRHQSVSLATVMMREGYSLESVQNPDQLSDEQTIKSAQKQWSNQTIFSNIDRDIESKARNQFQSKIVPSLKDSGVVQRLCENQSVFKDEVERAFCRHSDDGRYSMHMSEDIPLKTTFHEYGHGVVSAFDYGYAYPDGNEDATRKEKYQHRPSNLSHEFNSLCSHDTAGRFLNFEFSDDSDYYDPQEYMLRDKSDSANQPERFGEWKSRVDKEAEEGRGMLPNANVPEREYQSVEGRSAGEVFASLEPDDSVAMDVRKKKRDPDTGALTSGIETNREYLKLKSMNEDNTSATFERLGGDGWKWMVDDGGDLVTSNGSEIAGVSHTDGDDTFVVTDDPAIDPDANTPDEKIQNLVSACNRAWYKQAKAVKNLSKFEKLDMVIGTGYSMTNAHETMSMTNEIMQTPSEYRGVRGLIDNHPTLAWAYCEVFTPSDEVLEHYGDKLRDIGCDIPDSFSGGDGS